MFSVLILNILDIAFIIAERRERKLLLIIKISLRRRKRDEKRERFARELFSEETVFKKEVFLILESKIFLFVLKRKFFCK